MFRLSLKSLFNQSKVEEIFLYPVKDEDKFIGIFYGYKNPIKAPIIGYEKMDLKNYIHFQERIIWNSDLKKEAFFATLRHYFVY